MTRELSNRVSALEADLQSMAKSVDSLASSINLLGGKIDRVSQTNWSTLAAWATVVAVMMGGIGTLSIGPIRDGLINLTHQFGNHEKLGFHPKAEVTSQVYKERLDRIEKWQFENNTESLRFRGEISARLKNLEGSIINQKDSRNR